MASTRGTLERVGACPEPWVLEAFVQGTLEATARRDLEVHMDRCHGCGETIAELARLFASGQAQTRPTDPSLRGSMQTTGGVIGPESGPGTATDSLGRYRLGRRLGAGAMGVVFEAHDPDLHRNVAVKLLHAGVGGGAAETRDRLLREARAMAQLAHPNVVAVHDVGRVGEQIFVAMELVPGTTLGRWLRDAPRSRSQILDAFVQAGRGLQAAHAVGLVHRDFKPDNVLVGADARARVTDFGLARPITSWSPAHGGSPSLYETAIFHDLTAQGAIVGTPAYMAPEQWLGRPADARSDQYSFCVALFEALAGRRPFAGSDVHTLAHNVLHGKAGPPPRSVPRWLRAALMTGLSKDPEHRHASMTVLLEHLHRDRPAKRRWAAIGGAMAIGAAATVGVLQWGSAETVPLDQEAADAGDATAAKGDTDAVDTAGPGPDAAAASRAAGCERRARTVEGHWNEARRRALGEHLAPTKQRAELRSTVIATIDAWAHTYASHARVLCSPDPETTQPELRRRCLRNAADHFDAVLVAVQERKVFETEKQLMGAAVRLPDLEHCASEPWLSSLPDAPTREQAGAARLIAQDLAAAEASAQLLLLTEAPGQAEHAAGKAEALGYVPLLAEAQLLVGRIAAARRQTDLAVQWLQQAIASAEAAGHEVVRGRAAIELVTLQGADQLRPADAKRWLRIAASHAQRVADQGEARAARLAEARFLRAQLELERARETLAADPDVKRDSAEVSEPGVAPLHISLSEVLHDLDDAEEATRHANTALEILGRTVGAEDLARVPALRALARAQLLAGELDEAERSAEAAAEIQALSSSLRHDIERGRSLILLGDTRAAGGQFEEAVQAYEKAKIHHYTGGWRSEPLLHEGTIRVRMGEIAEGVSLLREAVAVLEEEHGGDDPRMLSALRALGRAQREAGQIEQARATLLRAVELTDEAIGYGPLMARAQIDLAELEQRAGNDERALALFDDAHVPWVGAYGLGHPRVTSEVLARADLAWSLGQKDYARRLYGSAYARLVAHYGAEDPRTKRALGRRGDE